MKKFKTLLAVLLLFSVSTFAIEPYVEMKHEMRSTWLTTVWGIDWPATQGNSENVIKSQKNQMIKILDSLAVNNFNSVCFQVRTMSDALYKSSYEPWSNWLTGTRGKDPGWDPLAFVVEECHKRGMECLAWVNPYRYASETSAWKDGETETDYVKNGWVIDAGSNTKILNPGKPEVIEHIIKVLEEIVVGYDIDGMLFDDYYYNSAPASGDDADYNAYKSAGGTKGKDDWRRDNVHTFIKGVFDMIQKHKPWVRFGQAPPGTTYTSASLAAKYDLEACPCGYELCYSSQYVDIFRLMDEGVIDFISPQVYWGIGSSPSDYSKIVPWWGKVSKRFNRHLFVAQTIQHLNNASKGGMGTFAEFYDQTMINRRTAQLGSAGSIFYSQKYMDYKSSGQTFGNYMKAKAYQKPAIMPAMSWKETTDPGTVENLSYDDESLLSWTAMTDVKNNRYTVYAIPNGLKPENFNKELKYLLGTTYSTTYTIPQDCRSGYYFAVCVYDRFGNEWDAQFCKKNYDQTLTAPVLISPETDFTSDNEFDFVWTEVKGAEKYALDVATQPDFIDILKSVQVTSTTMSSNEIVAEIEKNKVNYWRVRAVAKGVNDGVSEIRAFKYVVPEITFPANNATELDPKVNFTWTGVSKGNVYLEVASSENFEDMVFTVESSSDRYQTPMCTLKHNTQYYARLRYNGIYSSVITFTTKYIAGEVPTFKFPLDGGTCYANSLIEFEPQEGAEEVILMVDSSLSYKFATRFKVTLRDFGFSIPASDVLLNRGKNGMEDGKTYYAKAMVKYYNEDGVLKSTDYCSDISFVYSSASSAIDSVTNGAIVKLEGNKVLINADGEINVRVSAVSMLGYTQLLYNGQSSNAKVSLEELSAGMYVILVDVNGETHTIKYLKK